VSRATNHVEARTICQWELMQADASFIFLIYLQMACVSTTDLLVTNSADAVAVRVADAASFKLRIARTLRGASRGQLSSEGVARSLAVSRRTMARRLLMEGSTFGD